MRDAEKRVFRYRISQCSGRFNILIIFQYLKNTQINCIPNYLNSLVSIYLSEGNISFLFRVFSKCMEFRLLRLASDGSDAESML